MKIVFATNNKHKLQEIRDILGNDIEIVSLEDIGCHEEIPETGSTLEANAHQKAEYIFDHYHLNCFADDTGLEVEALDGAPGVYSARFAGEHATPSENVSLLLERLSHTPEPRHARFRTIVALIDELGTHFFEGSIEGTITTERRGENGFGYDPVFIPEGEVRTFAQLSESEKNGMSHRGRAVKKLAAYLSALARHHE